MHEPLLSDRDLGRFARSLIQNRSTTDDASGVAGNFLRLECQPESLRLKLNRHASGSDKRAEKAYDFLVVATDNDQIL